MVVRRDETANKRVPSAVRQAPDKELELLIAHRVPLALQASATQKFQSCPVRYSQPLFSFYSNSDRVEQPKVVF